MQWKIHLTYKHIKHRQKHESACPILTADGFFRYVKYASLQLARARFRKKGKGESLGLSVGQYGDTALYNLVSVFTILETLKYARSSAGKIENGLRPLLLGGFQ